MKLKEVTIKNFRNLDGVKISFHLETNYIIGENNIGKSNLLLLLETLFAGKAFDEKDFLDDKNPIEILLSIKLELEELGFFEDYFSPDEANVLNIRIFQNIDDSYLSVVHQETGESIPYKALRTIHFLNYSSNNSPDKLLRFDSARGMGAVFKMLAKRFVEANEDKTYLDEGSIEELRAFINNHLCKIQSFKKFEIEVDVVDKKIDFLSKLFCLSNGDFNIDSIGCGVQYTAMASINILCQIMDIYSRKTVPFEKQLYTNSDGKKILPLILAIDEPEVHLHPFLQRSLVQYYKNIIQNKDEDFKALLKECFGIDGIDGQLLVVTHSTDVMLDDYRNLIRFFKKDGLTKVVCGSTRTLDEKYKKHLVMHFPELKEAFYSRCAIIVEGETEYGCMKEFSQKLGISLDDFQLSVINAHGAASISPTKSLFGKFGIPCVVVYDKDVKDGQQETDTKIFTNEICFEAELVKKLYKMNQTNLVRQIVVAMDENGLQETLDQNFGECWYKKLEVDIAEYTPKKLEDVSEYDENEFCNMYSSWFMSKKGISLGRIVGNLLPKECIPECYSKALLAARRISLGNK